MLDKLYWGTATRFLAFKTPDENVASFGTSIIVVNVITFLNTFSSIMAMVRVSKDRLQAKRKRRQKIIYNWLIIFACITLFLSLFFWFYDEPLEFKTITTCLSEKQATLYCSDNLDICQDQKRVFGYYFDEVNYVNCDYHVDVCDENSIKEFPTWIIEGQQSFKVLTLKDLNKICS